MGPVELYMTFDGMAMLEHELDQNLRFGRAFVQVTVADDASVLPAVLAECTLVLLHPARDERLSMPAQVVMIDDAAHPQVSLGIQLRPFGADEADRLAEFARAPGNGSSTTIGADTNALGSAETSPGEPAAEDGAYSAVEPDGSVPKPATEEAPSQPPACSDHQAETRPAQLRRLSYNEQQKVARAGILSDRVTVERLYGKSVWKSLLENPKVTVPEVARIARKGTVPRPLIEMILDNNAWVHATTVRRALMGNPKVSPEGILKLLRLTPRHELRSIHRGTAYSSFVREQARKLLG